MAKHKTATARANDVVLSFNFQGITWSEMAKRMRRALQLHAKAALARSKPKKAKAKQFADKWVNNAEYAGLKCFNGYHYVLTHADGTGGLVDAIYHRTDDVCQASCEACAESRGVFKK